MYFVKIVSQKKEEKMKDKEREKKKGFVNLCMKASIFPSHLTRMLYIDYQKTRREIIVCYFSVRIICQYQSKTIDGNRWDDICASSFYYYSLGLMNAIFYRERNSVKCSISFSAFFVSQMVKYFQ